ncbi:hypothetical protein KFJ24_10305 [Marinobacter sediminum]|uniref:hypothetical protein n=1 Tax=Marinobacter sediminum TaxID=256323 RepID=UPI00202DF8EA|nr:hypothetical protein [Marinobacter sediminum]MCM0612861.1 hypothetical protein [Marinobacter sediminum]
MNRTVPFLLCLLVLAGCQSPSPGQENSSNNTVFLSAQHCLREYVKELEKVHYGPCLKIITVDGKPPEVREDGFVELPVATPAVIGTSCVYRHADGSPIPATMETTEFRITGQTFTRPGVRWYLHAHKQARQVVGCEPTLSRSVYPANKTD